MNLQDEVTFELTNYCPFNCTYCSSAITNNFKGAEWEELDDLMRELGIIPPEFVVHISGGEPLFHRDIGRILYECVYNRRFARTVLHTNLITEIAYNARICEGIRTHGYLTPLNLDELHIVKRCPQGREAGIPLVHISSNYYKDCQCNHRTWRAGAWFKTPCNKHEPGIN